MRKILFATTALAAVSVASAASAQESAMMSAMGNDLNIGGYYEFGFASVDDDSAVVTNDDSSTYGDSELYIDFENTADNGLTYGVQLDIEMINGDEHQEKAEGKTAEEASLYIRGDFGEVHFGHDDGAFDRFLTWAPTHEGTFSQNQAQENAGSILNGTGGARHGSQLWITGASDFAGDDAKITYVSPNFSGFKFGASVQDNDDDSNNPAGKNEQSFGASYGVDLLGGSLSVTGSRYDNNLETSGDKGKYAQTNVGVKYVYGALTGTVNRAKGEQDGWDKEASEIGIGFKANDALDIGASRATSENEAKSDTAAFISGTATPLAVGRKLEGTYTSVSGAYKIAPGLKTTLAYNQFEIEDAVDKVNNNEGTLLVWQIEMSF